MAEPPGPQTKPQVEVVRRELAEMAEALLAFYLKNQATGSPEASDYSLDRLLASLAYPPAQTGTPGVQTRTSGWVWSGPPKPSTPQLLRSIQGLLHTGGPSPAAVAVMPTEGEAQAEGLLDARALERAIDALPSLEAIGRGISASQAMEALFAGSGGGALLPKLRQRLDEAAVLLGRAVDESANGSEIEALIRRLERPLLKLSLRDPTFLDDPQHPARQVVDLLDQYAMAADDKGRLFDSRLQRVLHLLVDRICSQPDPDREVFAMARDNLAKLLVPIRPHPQAARRPATGGLRGA